jgi:hypothetical protein
MMASGGAHHLLFPIVLSSRLRVCFSAWIDYFAAELFPPFAKKKTPPAFEGFFLALVIREGEYWQLLTGGFQNLFPQC